MWKKSTLGIRLQVYKDILLIQDISMQFQMHSVGFEALKIAANLEFNNYLPFSCLHSQHPYYHQDHFFPYQSYQLFQRHLQGRVCLQWMYL
jgi:hypothetical protein